MVEPDEGPVTPRPAAGKPQRSPNSDEHQADGLHVSTPAGARSKENNVVEACGPRRVSNFPKKQASNVSLHATCAITMPWR